LSDYKCWTQNKRPHCFPNRKMWKYCGPALRGFGAQDFGVYEQLRHKQNEIKNVELRYEKGHGTNASGFQGLWTPDAQIKWNKKCQILKMRKGCGTNISRFRGSGFWGLRTPDAQTKWNNKCHIAKWERDVVPALWGFRVRDFGVSKEKELCPYVTRKSWMPKCQLCI